VIVIPDAENRMIVS